MFYWHFYLSEGSAHVLHHWQWICKELRQALSQFYSFVASYVRHEMLLLNGPVKNCIFGVKKQSILTLKGFLSSQSQFHTHVPVWASGHEVGGTAGVHRGDIICTHTHVHTHTRTCRAILYGVWKAITPWQRAYRTTCTAAHAHNVTDNGRAWRQQTSRNCRMM